MKKIAYDTMKVDQLEIVDDSKTCCLKVNAVITREGVYDYPDGRAFKSRMELLKATRTARNAKITILDHPDSMVIMSQNQIFGTVEKPFFDRDRIRATLNFDKHLCPKTFLEKVRSGLLKDVSIGFYYAPDMKPGTWNGKPYDYVMRDIVIDHVAAGVLKGRCSFPSCGIGVDAMMRESASRVQNYGGKKMSKKTDYGHAKSPEEIEAEFNQCVAERMAEGANADPPITREQAEALCQASTEPADEPVPAKTLDQEEQSEWQKCIIKHTEAGMSVEEATEKCKEEGIVKGDQDAAFDNCVERLVAEGKTREEAEKECRAEHPVAEEDAEPEPTPMEVCVKDRMEATEESEEEAKTWCEAELAGEHQAVDSLIQRSNQLIQMKQQRDIEKKRQTRRHPL